MTETFLQYYGWVLVSLLGGLLTTLTFVLGANLHLGNFRLDAFRRQAILKATARKWIFALAALGGFAGVVYVSPMPSAGSPKSRCGALSSASS